MNFKPDRLSSSGFVMMAPRIKLPSELVEEILYRVPPLSLARFRTVCKRWNTLFNGKRFIENHLACARPQFMLRTGSKIYSVGISPDDSLDVRELNLDTGSKKHQLYRNFYFCDGFLLCPEVAIWNPWLPQQSKLIKPNKFGSYGIGYDGSRSDKVYKILGFGCCYSVNATHTNSIVSLSASIYEFETNKWKDFRLGSIDWNLSLSSNVLSLNGSLYWIAWSIKNWIACEAESRHCFIQSFDFSEEKFKPFCLLPCENDRGNTQILAVFKGDRFSVLEQCHRTRKIEIWVTKDKVSSGNGEDVSWIKFMIVSIPELPRLEGGTNSVSQPSYFIENSDDKRLIVCTCDEIGKACIYVVKVDAFKKMSLDFVVDLWPYHLVYVPSLVPIPSAQIQQQ